MSATPKRSLLIVNPNSTAAMTSALEPIVAPLLPASFAAHYFTGPPSSPPSINDDADAATSAAECLPLLLPLLADHDGVLIACYSAHPLVAQLRAATTKPVLGILEASVYRALAQLRAPAATLGIVTTGAAWEPLLAVAVGALLGGRGRLAGVTSTGLDADQLHRVGRDELHRRIAHATTRLLRADAAAEAICLGCAGMVGLRDVVADAAAAEGRSVVVIDGVEAGVAWLVGTIGPA